ncbi:hypothetical protein EIQ11_14325 [Xanthomonas campestris pv. campestris]
MDRRRSSGLGGDAGEAGGARVGLIRDSGFGIGIGNRESGIGNRESGIVRACVLDGLRAIT